MERVLLVAQRLSASSEAEEIVELRLLLGRTPRTPQPFAPAGMSAESQEV